jgi:hypothetical protein
MIFFNTKNKVFITKSSENTEGVLQFKAKNEKSINHGCNRECRYGTY